MQTKKSQSTITPEKALEMLKEGNSRFVQNKKEDKDLLQQVSYACKGQYPFATILSCIDSRVPAEIVFDQGIGDIFSIRIAGNIINEDILGSMEYACKVAGSKLIVVLGHSNCGAVKGACDRVELGNLTGLLEKILPTVKEVSRTQGEGLSVSTSEFVQHVAEQNVLRTIGQISNQSSILREMIADKKIDIAGGMYDVNSGMVTFFNSTEVTV
ncbi:MAG: carbonic anhydrase [Candidatus Scalindua sp. AMX11]|nr:MAG: carbonic anhydrase [Candidatus Scalindua sp.]NOG83104.1 carbonic anhydrase [Planctomycetota bacterium]RZV75877.1 MAG: carbonic anhydrase [Candidatus Scalindua sp. SCAELEC01]TDE64935.1 MAG: carbonic anhydrase [Candidatus Scalindua sp. AMX11]GJQ60216.1 MAG: carbonic anhydrase [Candidatus Scalindua sp.]